MKKNQLLKDIGGLILLSVVIALMYNFVSPKGLPLIRKEVPKETVSDADLFGSPAPVQEQQAIAVPDSTPKKQPEVPKDTVKKQVVQNKVVPQQKPEPVHEETVSGAGYKIITFEQFSRIVKEKRGMILDAREPEEYKEGRIPGAINIPYLSVDNYFEKIAMYPRDTLIAIYCNNLMCPLGKGLAEFMVQLEFKKLLLYEGGYDYWEREQMPIEK